MNKRPTIQTIAELAGVSRGTVDRVLNNRSYVRADVRARVLNAIQETGYLSPKEAHRQAAEAKLPLKPVRLGVLCQTGAVRSTRMSREAFRLRVPSWKSAMLRCVCALVKQIFRARRSSYWTSW